MSLILLDDTSRLDTNKGAPGVLGIWGECLFIFRDLGSTGHHFRGVGEQAHSFGDLRSPAKKQKKKKIGKSLHFVCFFETFSSAYGGIAPRPPLKNLNVFIFVSHTHLG